MADIYNFPNPNVPLSKLMLVCSCGCESFNLVANGTMLCAYCDTPVVSTEEHVWRERMPIPTPDEVAEYESADDSNVRNIFLGSAELARKKVMRELSQWSDTKEMALVIGYNVDGSGHSWVDIRTEDQRDWVLRKVDALREYVAQVTTDSVRTVNYVTEDKDEAQGNS